MEQPLDEETMKRLDEDAKREEEIERAVEELDKQIEGLQIRRNRLLGIRPLLLPEGKERLFIEHRARWDVYVTEHWNLHKVTKPEEINSKMSSFYKIEGNPFFEKDRQFKILGVRSGEILEFWDLRNNGRTYARVYNWTEKDSGYKCLGEECPTAHTLRFVDKKEDEESD